MINNEAFSKRLHQIMEYYQVSAAAFADAIHVGRSSISHILSGRNKPSLEFVMKIIDAFPEVELYWLLNGKGTFPKSAIVSKIKQDTIPPTPKTAVANPEQTTTDLFSTTKAATRSSSENLIIEKKAALKSNSRSIDRIVIFYTDGDFESYTQK